MTAPGKSHRNGISLAELFRMFPDDTSAREWFELARWGGEPWCPHCGSVNVQSGAAHKTMPFRCREKVCARRFSVRVGTPLEDSKLGYQTWAVAIYLVTTSLKGVSSMKLHRDLGITQKSAWHLAHRIREAWGVETAPFDGPVEVDETFIGGKEKQQAREQEAPRWPRAGGQGRRRWRERPRDRPCERGRGRCGGRRHPPAVRALPRRAGGRGVHGRPRRVPGPPESRDRGALASAST